MSDTTEHDQDDQGSADDETAERVLEKLRSFVASLDEGERAVLAALLAPGVASAYTESEREVVGFGMGWSPDKLPESLATHIRNKGIRVEFD